MIEADPLMHLVWEVCLFQLHRLPFEIIGVEPSFEDFRIANYLVNKRKQWENDMCPRCAEEAGGVPRTCPICESRWKYSPKMEKVTVKTPEGSGGRRRRFFHGED